MVKNNTTLRKYGFLFLLTLFHISTAQNAIQPSNFAELQAFENFQSRKYQSVISDVEKKSDITSDEQILLILSKLKTGQSTSEQAEKWIESNPKHPIKPLVSYHLGEYFFYQKDTLRSQHYLSQISSNDLTSQDAASYGFIYGVIQLNAKNYKNAKNLFGYARRNGYSEADKLTYYRAFADYHLGDREESLKGFEMVKDTEDFGNSSKFFIAKMRLDKGEVDEIIALAKSELSEEKSVTNSGFYQLIGEAYAQKNDIAKADAFFERAIELHPSKPTAALYYQAGVAKFKIGNEDQAIEYLTESGIRGGEYAQLSAFQLGRLHLKKKDYKKALTAYIEASASDDDEIREESYFHAATLNAKLGQFSEAINFADDYLEKYASSPRASEIQDLIAQSYLKTSNYDLAISHLKETGNTTPIQKEIFQKVTYLKATNAYNDGDFQTAQQWFQESLTYRIDQDINNQSNYHLGEISLRIGQYEKAIQYYSSQSRLDALSNYGIGYSYFNQRKYQQAIPYFNQSRSAANQNIKQDSRARLADCQYATKSYQAALQTYNALLNEVESPYLIFQKGMAQKNLSKGEEAISTFQRVFNSSRYGAEARFQSGMIHFEDASFSQAEDFFTQVIDQYANSSFVVESRLNRGISRKNLGELDQAREDYEAILDNYIDDEEALNAILGLQELEQAGLEVPKLSDYVARYKSVNPESGSLALVEFEAAKRKYFDFSYEQAAISFEGFLKDYPKSGNRIEAQYYLADSYYRIGNLEKAQPVFDGLKIIRNQFTGRILNRLGEINRKLQKGGAAEEAYKLLLTLDLTPKDNYNALQGLMLYFFETSSYEEAIQRADAILKSEWKPLNGDQEAIVIKARSRYQQGNLELAEINYNKLSQGKDVYAAEANFYLGLIAYEQNEHKKSLDLLFDLNANLGSYTEWVDQSYLLIAKNYIAMEELFQAKATLRSIIQHASNESIKEESTTLLNEIEGNEVKSDSSQTKN